MKIIHLPGSGLGKSILVICGFVFWWKLRHLNLSLHKTPVTILICFVIILKYKKKIKVIVITKSHPLLLLHLLY